MSGKDTPFGFPNGLSFGEWLRARRETHGYTVSSLSHFSHVDIGTISRLENNLTQCTMITAVRLGDVLNFSWVELYTHFFNASSVTNIDNVGLSGDNVITLKDEGEGELLMAEDVSRFIRHFDRDPLSAYAFLTRTLNRVLYWEDMLEGHERSPQEDIPEKVNLWIKSKVLRVELQYPVEIDPKIVLKAFERGAAVIPKDIEIVLKVLNPNLPKGTKTVASILFLRLQSATVERAKLQDVLQLDELLDQQGKLLMSYWNACKFLYQGGELESQHYDLAGEKTDEEIELRGQRVLDLISMYRWMQHMNVAREWVDELKTLTAIV